MQSRMDRYSSKEKIYERTRKNTQLYEDVYNDLYKDTTYKNMEVIDSAKEINLNKLKNILDDKYETRQYRTLKKLPTMEEEEVYKKPQKRIYDINEIISEAKSKRAFIEEAKEKQKYVDFTKRSKKYDIEYDELEKEEKELEDLINTMTISKEKTSTEEALDLFGSLKGNDNTIVTRPIQADDMEVGELTKEFKENLKKEEEEVTTINSLEKTLIKADKTFYTDSNMFTKNDFEDFATLSGQLKKTGKKKVFFTLVSVLLIVIAILAYFIISKGIIK